MNFFSSSGFGTGRVNVITVQIHFAKEKLPQGSHENCLKQFCGSTEFMKDLLET